MMKIERLTQPGVSWTPHNYQKKAMRFLLERGAAALFLDPGLGKTSITLGAFKVLKKKRLARKMLVVAPLRVAHLVWPAEQKKWTDFHGLRVVVLHDSNQRRREELLHSDADVYVINPEGLEWLLDAEIVEHISKKTGKKTKSVNIDPRRFKKLGFDILAIDELSMFKHTNSLRFKLLKSFHKLVSRRWGLTGSPAANGLLDLFGECYALDEGRTLGPYITHYRNKYFYPAPDGFNYELKDGADELIYERLAPLALRMDAEDYLKLPPLRENFIEVELPPAVRRIYDEVEEEFFIELEEGMISAANSGAAISKMRQIAGGSVYLTPELGDLVKKARNRRKDWLALHEEKTEALESLIDELEGQRLMVVYDFEHEVERLLKRFPKAGIIGGRSHAKDTQALLDSWKSGKTRLILAQPKAAARGLDGFQEHGSHIGFHTNTYDYELFDQIIRRFRRQGSTASKVTAHYIMAADTIDYEVLAALRQKDRTQKALFAALKRLSKLRRHTAL